MREMLENVAWLPGRIVLDVETQGRHVRSLCIQVNSFSTLVDLVCGYSGAGIGQFDCHNNLFPMCWAIAEAHQKSNKTHGSSSAIWPKMV
jgi:hypothetical protein